MPQANKEFILNYTVNRWGLNKKTKVGATSDSVRICAPKSCSEWEQYYYQNVRPYQHIDSLGGELYEHVKNDLPCEKRFHPELLNSISEQDCKEYMHMLVIDRVYNGYCKEHGEL